MELLAAITVLATLKGQSCVTGPSVCRVQGCPLDMVDLKSALTAYRAVTHARCA